MARITGGPIKTARPVCRNLRNGFPSCEAVTGEGSLCGSQHGRDTLTAWYLRLSRISAAINKVDRCNRGLQNRENNGSMTKWGSTVTIQEANVVAAVAVDMVWPGLRNEGRDRMVQRYSVGRVGNSGEQCLRGPEGRQSCERGRLISHNFDGTRGCAVDAEHWSIDK